MLAQLYECLLGEYGLTHQSSPLCVLRAARERMAEQGLDGRQNRRWRHAMLRSLLAIHALQQSRVW